MGAAAVPVLAEVLPLELVQLLPLPAVAIAAPVLLVHVPPVVILPVPVPVPLLPAGWARAPTLLPLPGLAAFCWWTALQVSSPEAPSSCPSLLDHVPADPAAVGLLPEACFCCCCCCCCCCPGWDPGAGPPTPPPNHFRALCIAPSLARCAARSAAALSWRLVRRVLDAVRCMYGADSQSRFDGLLGLAVAA